MTQEGKCWEGIPRKRAAEGLGEGGLETCWRLDLCSAAGRPVPRSVGQRRDYDQLGSDRSPDGQLQYVSISKPLVMGKDLAWCQTV